MIVLESGKGAATIVDMSVKAVQKSGTSLITVPFTVPEGATTEEIAAAARARITEQLRRPGRYDAYDLWVRHGELIVIE